MDNNGVWPILNGILRQTSENLRHFNHWTDRFIPLWEAFV